MEKAKYPWKEQFLLLTPLLALLAWCWFRFGSEAELVAFFQQHREANPVLTRWMLWISRCVGIPLYAAYLGIAVQAFRRRDRRSLGFVIGYVVSLIASLIVARTLKFALSRPRPPAPWEHFAPFTNKGASFPSTHVTEALVTSFPLAQRFGRLLPPLALGLFPAFMGVSRMYLGRHYPSDFLGSIIIGTAGAALAWHIARWAGNRFPDLESAREERP